MQIDIPEGPWYRKHNSSTVPFSLTKLITSRTHNASQFHCIAPFPWKQDSLSRLYDTSPEKIEELQPKWQASIHPWLDSVMVGADGCAYIFRKSLPPLCIKIPRPEVENRGSIDCNVRCVAWALEPTSWTRPVVVLAACSLVFIYDPTSLTLLGALRGHGAEITCVAVHHTHPYIFLTTSRDHTTRLWDLRHKPRQVPNNPTRLTAPTKERRSSGGPAYGLHMNEPEGEGIGRCLAVLAGARSGGHEAAVLHAAWHPNVDLIATCGADHSVKVWRMPYINYAAVGENREHLAREDKPLFSTDLVHSARILSIWWLSDDVLISHSAPALMRGKHADHMYEDPGVVAVWQWLGFRRFLPKGILQKNMTGCKDDWQSSESFRILSVYSVPMLTPSVHVSRCPAGRYDPLLFVPDGPAIRIFNTAEFLPRTSAPFPHDSAEDDDEDDELDTLTSNLSLSAKYDFDWSDRDEPETYNRAKPERKLFEEAEGWIANCPRSAVDVGTLVDVEKCVLAFDGQMLLGVGRKGTLYRWTLMAR